MHDDASSDASVSPRDIFPSVSGEGPITLALASRDYPAKMYIKDTTRKSDLYLGSAKIIYKKYNKVIRPVSRISQDFISKIQQGNQTCN